MDGMLQGYARQFDDFIEKHKDPRVDGWPLMESVWTGPLIVLTYLVVVTWLGPKLMEGRKPFDLRKVLVVYNAALVMLSAYMVVQFALGGWFTGYTLGCQLVEYDRSPRALTMVHACYVFYISKFIEMLDTIFFILRKKKRQLSFLHIFHHSIMPFGLWIGIRCAPGGFGSFGGILNSFVHVVMYSYYLLAALGPHMRKHLWWKKYITKLQLIQFLLVILHCSQLFFIECAYPKILAVLCALASIIFTILFEHFYTLTYLNPSRPITSLDDDTGSNGVKCVNGVNGVNGVHSKTN